MAVRANWKGYLKLSLVSCAVALYPASSTSERVSFHNLNGRTGRRLRQQMVDEETGEAVDAENRVKGYEVDRGDYVMLSDEELESIEIESTKTINIETFVPRDEIDEIYLDNTYYVAPDDAVAEEAFAVIRDAMERQGLVGIGRVVLSKRERIVMIEPRGKGLMATLLRYDYEVRDDSAYFEDIDDVKIPGEMLDLARHIIDSKAGHFEPKEFEDRYQAAVVELIKAKQAGRTPPSPPKERPSNVVNLMDALRRSAKAEGGASAAPGEKKASRPATRRPSSPRGPRGGSGRKPRRAKQAG